MTLQVAFAYEDERTGAKTFDPNARKASVQTTRTPWRVIVLADEAGGILTSTLVTDVAQPCQIKETSWIQTGRASWAWWSHPDGPTNQSLFNEFTALAFTSGIIHYADSSEMFRGFPDEVKQVLREAPAAWDETVCLIGDPGRIVVLARRTGDHWFIVGLNGTSQSQPVVLDLARFGPLTERVAVTEGRDPLMQFSVERLSKLEKWDRPITPLGGFVLCLKPAQ